MNNDFIEYCKDARRTFVNKFMRTYPTAKERVMAEDLLITYDQLMQRHEEMRDSLIKAHKVIKWIVEDKIDKENLNELDYEHIKEVLKNVGVKL